VQILLETPTGIANADAIAELDGVDMLAIGANDFTAELGVPGQYEDPRVRDAVATTTSTPHPRPPRRQLHHPRPPHTGRLKLDTDVKNSATKLI
jgi:hypothetical protein